MAIRSLFANLKRTTTWRSLTSRASPVNSFTKPPITKDDDLGSIIFRLKFPRRNATAVIEKWVDSGHKLTTSELRSISRTLLKSKRYKHALEILTWMEKQNCFRMSAADHAIRLELIIKVHGLTEAEEYFTCIPNSASQKAASLPLLHGYVIERAVDKAETFMRKLSGLGLIVSCHPCNEIMKLYMETSQYNKVLLVIQQMKQNKIPRNVLSYNLWMNACAEISGVTSVEMVYKEMQNDINVEVGWSSLSTLANVYIKEGLINKALLVIKCAEKKLSTCNRLGYFFLMTLYTSLNNKKGVFRLWEASKAVGGRITCANYMCVISCLVKLGDLVEAKRILLEWESHCLNYDIRVSNILLGAYMRNGLIKEAESLHLHTLERGGCPNYKTWEILMEGWVKSGNMNKAIDAMKKGFAMLRHCDWRPSEGILLAFAEYFENHGNLEDANQFIRAIHHLGLSILPLNKSLLRMHVTAQKPAVDILEMMEKDIIVMGDNTSALV
ncbi:hypothetical protein ACOSP7_010233 [Xanthoceras sorbifolium]|uniref:Pentatricopeptide repeat-containing protein n=1 Tax=Xanthoceras sorbifolium TaxID=99658 RepID=A0ABQ8GZB8_9ROSI|nr:hypothetical protein JRO89_XSUnG0153500 [Xanthoceras sorbifolium]